MGDVIKAILAAPISTVLIMAGLIFLFIAVVGRISTQIDPGRTGRIASGVLGTVFLIVGLYFMQHEPSTSTSITPTATQVSPTNTPVPPTVTRVPPTNTPLPPTVTRVPPTNTPLPPTVTPLPRTTFGQWRNQDLNTQGITRINIGYKAGVYSVETWGKCTPTDCYWNSYQGVKYEVSSVTQTTMSITWTFSFVVTTLKVAVLADGRLQVLSHDHFTDNSGRKDADYTYYFVKTGD